MTASCKISHFIGSDLVAIQAVIALNKIGETSKLKEANRTEISSDHTRGLHLQIYSRSDVRQELSFMSPCLASDTKPSQVFQKT